MLPVIDRIIKNVAPKHDDDFVDRLNYVYTASMLVLFVVVIGLKQYVGEPLQCFVPAEFKGSWEQYIENYCFVENTYFVQEDSLELPHVSEREEIEIPYYQWVPLLLTMQLVLFIVPKAIWGGMFWKTGVNVRVIVGNGSDKSRAVLSAHKPDDETTLRADYLETIVQLTRKRRRPSLFQFFDYGCYVTTMYLTYKLMNVVNVVLQIYVMNRYLNSNYGMWGFNVLQDLIANRHWKESGAFPRVTYCDFMRRDDVTSRPLNVTVQCVLMLNMFNEKMYIILWFWFVGLAIANIVNFIRWLIIAYSDSFAESYIRHLADYVDISTSEEEFSNFVKDGFTMDTVTAVRLLECNLGDFVAAKLVGELHKRWKTKSAKVVANGSTEKAEEKNEKAQNGGISNVQFEQQHQAEPLPSKTAPETNNPPTNTQPPTPTESTNNTVDDQQVQPTAPVEANPSGTPMAV